MTATESAKHPVPPNSREGQASPTQSPQTSTSNAPGAEVAVLRDLIVSHVHRLDADALAMAAVRLGLIDQDASASAQVEAAAEVGAEDDFPTVGAVSADAFWEEIDKAEALIDAGEGVPFDEVKALLQSYR